MFIKYIRVYCSRKLRRLFITLFVVSIVSTLLVVMTVLDITCIPRPYNPRIRLKSTAIKPFTKESDPKWTPIVDNIISIYSAFDYLNQTIIIGIIDQRFISQDFYCKFKHNIHNIRVEGVVHILPESWADYYNYVSIKIICPKNQTVGYNKIKVSFKQNNQNLETSYVNIKQIYDYNNDKKKEIVVCVRPLFGSISSAELLEFIAYYISNGIQRIVFYELSISEDIKQLLVSLPFVDLLSYNLPIDSSSIHADGQIAALNDCLLRSTDSVVIHVDIDELMVTSTKFLDIKDFIEHKIKDESIGALIIPNVMICDEFNDNNFPRILSATVRQTSKWDHHDRSKSIVLKPLSVDRLGIHTVWSWKDRTRNDNINQRDVMLFHYRSCCRVWQPFYQNKYLGITLFFIAYEDKVVTDLSVRRFESKIRRFLKHFVDSID